MIKLKVKYFFKPVSSVHTMDLVYYYMSVNFSLTGKNKFEFQFGYKLAVYDDFLLISLF
jgi:hypothetical protein